MKVGRRQGNAKVDVLTFAAVQNAFAASPQGRTFIPKGVWRFKSFEEAEEWNTNMRNQARNRSPKT